MQKVAVIIPPRRVSPVKPPRRGYVLRCTEAREIARHARQVAIGSLRVENGYVGR
jgi:hypothetical protein